MTIFCVNYGYINKSIVGSIYLSTLYTFYVCKIIDCIFNIFEYMTEYKNIPWPKMQQITFNLRNKIYIDSILLFMIAFMIAPYIYYNFIKNTFIVFYVNAMFFLIPSITIIQSK